MELLSAMVGNLPWLVPTAKTGGAAREARLASHMDATYSYACKKMQR